MALPCPQSYFTPSRADTTDNILYAIIVEQGIIFGSILGADGVGKIVDIKAGSSKHRVGDRVVVMPSIGWDKDPRGPEEAYYILGGGHAGGNSA